MTEGARSMALATQREIQRAYEGEKTAAQYTSVLEIAPGPGRVTRDIQPTGRLVCLEYNEGMIAAGRAVCGDKAEWVQGNAFALPFTELFDFVYSFRFIRHFRRADRERLYAQVRRVLRPGGYFVMDAVNARVSRPLREADPDQYPIYDKLYCLPELCDELTDAGLKPLGVEPVQKFFRWQYRSQVLLGPRADWLNWFLIRALESLPAREGLEWIVTCRRA
jgi:ubiquinone/menaquinone biosynthesis C-methylase UbiE